MEPNNGFQTRSRSLTAMLSLFARLRELAQLGRVWGLFVGLGPAPQSVFMSSEHDEMRQPQTTLALAQGLTAEPKASLSLSVLAR